MTLERSPLLVGLLVCQACPSPTSKESGEPPETTPGCDACVLADANNYSAHPDLSSTIIALQPLADIRMDWGGLDRDVWGRPMSPDTDVTSAWLELSSTLSPDDIADGMASESLLSTAFYKWATCAPSDPSCTLSQFVIMGHPFYIPDGFYPDRGSWMVALMAREGFFRTVFFVDPIKGVKETDVIITSDTAVLDAGADLSALTPVRVVADSPAITLDWSGLTLDGLGNAWASNRIDGLWVGHFDASKADLEGNLFDLASIATGYWEMDATGMQSASLADLEGDDPFTGIGDGTWLVGLTCSTCLTPYPRFITVLQPDDVPDLLLRRIREHRADFEEE